MNRIIQLSTNLINKIAAGEVIERPSSVVKELVENSIDAGAKRIEITISNSCRNIRIADNGSGIHPDDIPLAFSKHATSKLSDESGLFNIKTLGFRGEALSSIISIAKVTCITRCKEFDYGTKAESSDSIVKSSKTGCAIGTIMEVNDLFYNQPARLKFLKSEKTEFSYIHELVQSFAIANPSIAFILKNDNTVVLTTSQDADLLTRISQVYSESIINNLKIVDKTDDLSGIHVWGYISTPDFTRSSRKSIYTFVNSRIVKCPILSKAIDTAYNNMLAKYRYPFVILNLDINADDIDINVHPQKREIRYKNPNQIFSFVKSALDYALSENSYSFDNTHSVKPQNKIVSFNETLNSKQNDEVFYQEQKSENFKSPFPLKMVKNEDNNGYKIEKPAQVKMDISFGTPNQIKSVNVIGQLCNTYIMVENEDNLEIIDQHIADERYLYEKLKEEKEVNSQLLIISNVIDVEPSDLQLLENASSQLEKFGYKIEKISDTQIIFRKIPQILSNVRLQDIISELISNLKDSPENDLDMREEKILITTACKAAIKAGDKLTLWQMEEVVKKLRKTKNPHTCPHGRPISHCIPLKEIASFFERAFNGDI